MQILYAFGILLSVSSGPEVVAQTAAAPSAALSGNTTVIGVHNSTTGLDTFLGIRYAHPPLGNLRFALPSLLLSSEGVINASAYGPVCMQVPSTTYPLSSMSEDCLFINVIRPPAVKLNAQLPVLVWIYGGSFITGGNPTAETDPAVLVTRSIQIGEPIIYVSMNYRLNSFGFLASSELAAAAQKGTATLNAGLYDIQLALTWVRENIAAFGGNPDAVTVFGESAGAFAIGSFLIADGGKAVERLGLFRGGIMESGAPSGDGVPPPSQLDSNYSQYATLAGCGTALSLGPALPCLRAASTGVLLSATIALLEVATLRLPFNRVVDDYFFTAAPSFQVRARELAQVPLMMADLYHQYTTPALQNILLPALLKLYPDNPVVGSPFAPVGVPPTDRFYSPLNTNQYKRFSAILGDAFFQAGRRILLEAYTAIDRSSPVYNYLFAVNTPGAPPALGVYHTSEIPFVYGGYAYLNSTNALGRTSLLMMDYWIAFTNTLNPNRPGLPTWPTYGSTSSTIEFTGGASINGSLTQVITDTYRKEGIAFLGSVLWSAATNI